MFDPRPIKLSVNGRMVEATVDSRVHLADFLRKDLALTGTHLGCEHGVCGACTVQYGTLVKVSNPPTVMSNGATLACCKATTCAAITSGPNSSESAGALAGKPHRLSVMCGWRT